jgi:hypothetical protein
LLPVQSGSDPFGHFFTGFSEKHTYKSNVKNKIKTLKDIKTNPVVELKGIGQSNGF